jgi:hypothetical protein
VGWVHATISALRFDVEPFSSGCADASGEYRGLDALARFRESQHAHCTRLTRNSPSETIALRNRSLVIDRNADQLG